MPSLWCHNSAKSLLRCTLCFYLVASSWARERVGFNVDWLFQYGHVEGVACDGGDLEQLRRAKLESYRTCAPCGVPSGADPCYDDSHWRSLSLPHDYVIEGPGFSDSNPSLGLLDSQPLMGPFDPFADTSHGFIKPDVAWYRRVFSLPADWVDGAVWIEFDGVYRSSDVYLNGKLLGHHESGFTSFYYYIEGEAKFGEGVENVLSVYCDATEPEGWWYDGGGIYRHVWVNRASKVHIPPWGLYAPALVTGSIDAAGTVTDQAEVWASIELSNTAKEDIEFHVHSQVRDQAGNPIESNTILVTVPKLSSSIIKQTFQLGQTGPKYIHLWSPESPVMYTLTSTLTGATGAVADMVTVRFGIRKVVFDKDHGLFLNSRSVKIHGMCNHQDFGGTGVGVPMGLQKFRIREQMSAGVNAWRMSHNPPNPELLDYLDEAGMIVWAENRNFYGKDQWYVDFADMLRRDRNHPSILFWSLCNEGWRPEGCLPSLVDGEQIGLKYKAIVTELDPYGQRALTAAMDEGWGKGVGMVLDVQGINYRYEQYDFFHMEKPNTPIIGSESASCTTDRGTYSGTDIGYCSAYPTLRGRGCSYPSGCADNCLEEWMQPAMEKEFVMGGFAWTGFDYKGEPTPDLWPTVNAHYGALFDMAGFPKDSFYYYQAWWTSKPVLHILPHWNWEVNLFPSGMGVKVWVYTQAASVRLYLNGEFLASSPVPRYGHAAFQVYYVPGNLTAVGLDAQEKVLAHGTVLTSGEPAALVANVAWGASGISGAVSNNVARVTVKVVDAKGILVPTASNRIHFSASGGGAAVVGVANGDPSSLEPDRGSLRNAFRGRVAAVVQLPNQPSAATEVKVTATALGLGSVTVVIPIVPAYERELAMPSRSLSDQTKFV